MFSHLRKIYGPGLVNRGIVNISNKIAGRHDTATPQIIEGKKDVTWHFLGVTGNYVMFQLFNHSFSIFGMKIRTGPSKWYHNPSFSIDVSNDSVNWVSLYSENYSTKLTSINSCYTWKFPKSYLFLYVRMYATKNQNNQTNHGIYMTSIDFLINEVRDTCNIRLREKPILIYVIVFILIRR